MSRVPVLRTGAAAGSARGGIHEEEPEEMRSKGLLPAIGVGGAVYLITGYISVGTLALVGVGAGVGYGIGLWISEKYETRRGEGGSVAGVAREDLPDALQVGLSQWQVFLMSRAGQAIDTLSQEEIERHFQGFAEQEPLHAQNVRVAQGIMSGAAASQATALNKSSVSGVTIVPLAEV